MGSGACAPSPGNDSSGNGIEERTAEARQSVRLIQSQRGDHTAPRRMPAKRSPGGHRLPSPTPELRLQDLGNHVPGPASFESGTNTDITEPKQVEERNGAKNPELDPPVPGSPPSLTEASETHARERAVLGSHTGKTAVKPSSLSP